MSCQHFVLSFQKRSVKADFQKASNIFFRAGRNCFRIDFQNFQVSFLLRPPLTEVFEGQNSSVEKIVAKFSSSTVYAHLHLDNTHSRWHFGCLLEILIKNCSSVKLRVGGEGEREGWSGLPRYVSTNDSHWFNVLRRGGFIVVSPPVNTAHFKLPTPMFSNRNGL